MKPVVAVAASVVVSWIFGACGGSDDGNLSSKEVFERARPATVQIFGRIGDSVGGGTGVVIDAREGLVLTNDHVMAGLAAAKAKTFRDDQVPVRLVGTAPCEDVALVKMRSVPEGVTAIKLGSSRDVENEDEVVALGYPLTLQEFLEQQKVVSTNGAVSVPETPASLGPSSPRYASTIQHTATINPGNSGGPLLNHKAELIGINSLGFEGSGIENQFYAITAHHIQRFLPELQAGKRLDFAGWDIAALADVPLADVFEATGYGTREQGEQAQQLLREQSIDGMFVYGVTAASPAEKAQIGGGDLITEIQDTPVKTAEDVCEVLKSAAPGEALRVRGRYLTSGGQEAQYGDPWVTTLRLRK